MVLELTVHLYILPSYGYRRLTDPVLIETNKKLWKNYTISTTRPPNRPC